MVLCVFQASTARCLAAGSSPADDARRTPSLDNCARSCANIARTDRHIEALGHERASLEAEARHAPHPIAVRLRDRITDIDRVVAEHQAAR